ncbi:MAG TPA: UbiA family prenyltransferase [Actinophytocola sp.]|uniref:UbiA family prenyltransferase n=1 Tax=Actinophytocola sp. TaxID=1872138 RepID=UPI002DDDB9B0|nr:UbiA family prenyltransferase [Actinophytocola sp.]HEV2781778.1 UbiA family prenyltransferase [Actinophytocola sp.]
MPGLAWRDLFVIHRLEYPLALTYLCYAGWGAGYAAGRAAPLAPAVLAVAANALLILAALALNAAADVRTDELDADKGDLAGAVLRLGRGRTLGLAGAEAGAGLACACAVALLTGRWIVPGLAVAAAVLHLAYNVEPVRLKRRGFAGPPAFGLGLVGMPFLLAYCAVAADGSVWPVWPVFAGLTVLAIGRTAWWSVPDRAADTVAGVGTPAVRHGAARALGLACLIMLAGLVLLALGLARTLGFAWVIPGIAAHAAFLITSVALLSQSTLPNGAVRRRGTTLVVIGEVVLTALPLVA